MGALAKTFPCGNCRPEKTRTRKFNASGGGFKATGGGFKVSGGGFNALSCASSDALRFLRKSATSSLNTNRRWGLTGGLCGEASVAGWGEDSSRQGANAGT
eukprot:3641295-Pyramimonas_sp.AAC.1